MYPFICLHALYPNPEKDFVRNLAFSEEFKFGSYRFNTTPTSLDAQINVLVVF